MSDKAQHDYFQLASSWADDYYALIQASRNRYRIAFLSAMTLSVLLVVAIIILMPLEHFEPLIVHEYQDGVISIEPANLKNFDPNQAMIESEIVRYVIAREAYDPVSYQVQYRLVELMSNHVVSQQYRDEQGKDNPDAVINKLANKLTREVRVESIMLHKDFSQVNFTIIDVDKSSKQRKSVPLVATIVWEYRGIPKNPKDRWDNWDGFTVTDYHVVQRNI
jgi:type IV secretion system protein VirB8